MDGIAWRSEACKWFLLLSITVERGVTAVIVVIELLRCEISLSSRLRRPKWERWRGCVGEAEGWINTSSGGKASFSASKVVFVCDGVSSAGSVVIISRVRGAVGEELVVAKLGTAVTPPVGDADVVCGVEFEDPVIGVTLADVGGVVVSGADRRITSGGGVVDEWFTRGDLLLLEHDRETFLRGVEFRDEVMGDMLVSLTSTPEATESSGSFGTLAFRGDCEEALLLDWAEAVIVVGGELGIGKECFVGDEDIIVGDGFFVLWIGVDIVTATLSALSLTFGIVRIACAVSVLGKDIDCIRWRFSPTLCVLLGGA